MGLSKKVVFGFAKSSGIKIHKGEFLLKNDQIPPLGAKKGVFWGKIKEKILPFMQFSHSREFSTSLCKTVEKLVGTVENSKNRVFSRVCLRRNLWKTFAEILSSGNMQKDVFLLYAQK